jgi:predicted metal-dependent hydrolase
LKLPWIRLQQEKLKHRHTHQELEYKTGEEIYIWGKAYHLIVKDTDGRARIEVTEEEVLLFIKHENTREQRKKLLHTWYKKALEQEIPFLLARWEKKIGVKADSFSIRDMKTRWGTCHIQKKAICLNLQLAKKSPSCLEYVLVHELVHLLEKSHNHVFKGYMDQFLPNWRSIRNELNGAPSAFP